MQGNLNQARIFVQIASYRDPECRLTVKDLFEKAAFPERINVGICLQIDPEADKDCALADIPRPEQVRIVEYHIRDAKGAGWARVEAQTLAQDEEYLLQIQAHMRFEKNWDNTLIERLESLPEKSVITAWLPGYVPPDKKLPLNGTLPRVIVGRLGDQNDAQMVHLLKRDVPQAEIYGKMPLCCSWVGNFLFCRTQVMKDIPFDPYIYFWGEEINYSTRLWTHGYDIYQLDRIVLYHYWDRNEAKDRPTYRDHRIGPNQLSLMRNLHLFGIVRATDARATQELEKYPLGTERTLEEYWTFCGYDLMEHTLSLHARTGEWSMPEKAAKRVKNALPTIFINIASFRDPEIIPTLKDLFAKAAQPERIHVGICLQIDPQQDDNAASVSSINPKQIRITQVPARNSKGANWARAMAQELYKNEDYVLQIDSHMRFEQGWDTALVEMLERCPERAVLSTYVPRYVPPDTRTQTPGEILRLRVFDFGEQGNPQLLHLTKVAVPLSDKERSGLYISPFYIANFLFCRADVMQQVPFDPRIQFWGDEITYSARLWTHGYDIYQPDRYVLYHYWRRDDLVPIQDYRRMNTPRSKHSFARVKHLLEFERSVDEKALEEIDRYGLGKERTLDSLWKFAGINWETRRIAMDSLNGKWDMGNYVPVKNQKQQAAGPYIAVNGRQPSIFVNIASYRDPECQWTVKDLFDKAEHPDRINVGICWQFDPDNDRECFQVSTRPEQVRMLPVDWREANGVCWARNQVQQLWEGEDFNLMIDSHMRFMPGWDTQMMTELARCDSAKPVLSSSPARYTPPNNLHKAINPTIRRVKPFTPDGNIRCQGEFLDRIPEKPLNAAFLVANFVFSQSNIIPEVPYDPYLYFDQEEITYALRLYTHGWDIFSPSRQFLYHYYNDAPPPEGYSRRPMHWNDLKLENRTKINFLRSRGLRRFNHLTRYDESYDPQVTAELGRYGLGKQRTIEAFEEYSGVDFKNKIASEKALRGLFVRDLQKYRNQPIIIPGMENLAQAQPKKNGAKTMPATSKERVIPTPAPKMPVLHPQSRGAATLEPGDFLPLFELNDTSDKPFAVELLAGRPMLLFVLSKDDPDYLLRLSNHLRVLNERGPRMDAWTRFVIDDSRANLSAFREKNAIPFQLASDPQRTLAQSFGLAQNEGLLRPVGYLINNHLRVEKIYRFKEPEELGTLIFEDCYQLIHNHHLKNLKPQVVTEIAPTLIVPDALPPELCDRLIQSFRNGHTYDGTVGAAERTAYRPNNKVRTDHVPQGELLKAIDEKLSRSLFPEIEKVFGFEVTFREMYKVGLYTGEKKGFFRQHRDNFEAPLGYRRIAMTLHLTDDYEGGGLVFPEYGRTVYRPRKGAAITFSCATMHEALPVTKGERFVLVGFFHGDQEEAFRRHFQASKQQDLRIPEYTPLRSSYAELKRGRDFFREWQQKHVHIDGLKKKPD